MNAKIVLLPGDGIGPEVVNEARLVLDDGDMRERSIPAFVVETVADDEMVLDRESDILHAHVYLPARGLAQEAGRPHAAGTARHQNLAEIIQRQARVDDVFDDEHVTARERRIEVLSDRGEPRPAPPSLVSDDPER